MNDDGVVINLVQLWEIIKKNIIIFLSICIVCTGIGFSLSSFVFENKYEATAKIIIVKDESADSSSSVTYNDIQLSQKLASTYKQILMSEAISDTVINNLHLDDLYNIGTKQYNEIVTVNAESNTEVMSIKTETNDPELSANISNEIVDVFISKIYNIYDVNNVTILNRAKVPTKKSWPSNFKFAAIGGVIGLLLCAIIAIIKYFTDTKVKTEEEVKAIFDYPIIGSVPEFAIKEVYEDE